ncbi:MAG: class I SAM-dependent methyltransferase [Pseudomonadota bacterium]
MLKVARAKLQHVSAAKLELIQGDFTELPFASGQFDTVLLHQVLHFAANPAIALAEAARVTKPGGRIAIVDFASHEREELRTRHQHLRLGFTDPQMQGLLQRAGFIAAPPAALDGGELVVKIWIAERRAIGPKSSQTPSSPSKKALP